MIDCSLYFSTICYVRLSKITAALLLPRRESKRIPLLQERCFPIASAKVEHFCIPCKTSTKKKCEKNSFHPILSLHSMAKSAIKPIFSLHPLPTISHPKPSFFVPFGHFWGENHLFRGFFSSAREKFSPEISFCAEKISLMGRFSDQSTRNSTFAGEEKEKAGVFSSNHRRSHIKMEKGVPK